MGFQAPVLIAAAFVNLSVYGKLVKSDRSDKWCKMSLSPSLLTSFIHLPLCFLPVLLRLLFLYKVEGKTE